MPEFTTPLPCRRPELVVRPLGDHGPYVVKDPHTGAYYHLGDEEHFLLMQLDGQRDSEAIRAAFAERFGQPLTEQELQDFLDMARAQGLFQSASAAGGSPAVVPPATGDASIDTAPLGLRLLYWRRSLFDPDRLFTWLAPKLWFFWTPAFLGVSAGCILLAAALVWTNRQG